ncbi:hypothetical protein EG327_009234 [Venturia inaequalis]|uniref:Uncharacterized protein n=1 Tax=Venturia inaequalis TaxID=5025 RepID=A0A8H3VND4_VENIN|nr:hypothetical protein EG327_009234 [Venturia inaequalis]
MIKMPNLFSLFKSSQPDRTPEQVFVLSSTRAEDVGGPAYLDDLLSSGLGSHGNHFLLRAGDQKMYDMWVFAVDSACSWALEDASAHLSLYLRRGRESSATVLFSMHNGSDVGKERRETYLTTVLRIDSEVRQSHTLSKAERNLHHTLGEADPSPIDRLRTIFPKLAIILCVLLFTLTPATFILISNHPPPPTPHLWMHWTTHASTGPKNQLQFTSPHPSYKSWAKQYNQEGVSPTSHFIRIDDQSMIPPHLIDATERKYQKWFANRYPEMRAIRDTGAFLNESFHAHPFRHEIPTDRFLHPAHCVMVLRRYVKAVQTKRHVCPRDIDVKHVAHCLDSLDGFVFVDGERGTEPVLVEGEEYTQPWLPNLCF